MRTRRYSRTVPGWVVVGFAALGALVQGGCPPQGPPPPDDLEVDVTVVGQGDVDQSADGSNVTLTAVPAAGWRFDSWSRDDVPDEPEITVDATVITAITVTFVVDPATLDSDADGVPDANDRCPSTPARADVDDEGCAAGLEPDSDSDGVNDDQDQCPNTGQDVDVDAEGCPVGDPTSGDDDGDGVPNNVDQCPNTPAGTTVDVNGCAASEADSDGDGVLDNADDCPNTPPGTDVDNAGCPTGGNGNGPVCGNNVVESGEQCDDGNTVGGDGCSPTCQTETSTGLANNSCSSPTTVNDGSTEITNVGATTDGPDEAQQCDFFSRTQVESDVWFCYTASCTGQATISLCGSSYDTKLAVYNGCQCPATTNTAVDCSDDDCGSGVENVQSRLTVNVTSGQQYMLRVGGFIGEQGDGQLTITCGGGDVCATGTGNCLTPSASGEPGCEDDACCNTVCDVDQFCCDIEWDEFCASEAEGLCDEGFDACATTAASCTTADTEPGCNNVSCCNTVCDRDPFCCIDTWDSNCVSEAQAFCALSCNSRAGDCFTVHDNAGCNLVACCQLVCPEDPFCCDTEWDTDCVQRANELCR